MKRKKKRKKRKDAGIPRYPRGKAEIWDLRFDVIVWPISLSGRNWGVSSKLEKKFPRLVELRSEYVRNGMTIGRCGLVQVESVDGVKTWVTILPIREGEKDRCSREKMGVALQSLVELMNRHPEHQSLVCPLFGNGPCEQFTKEAKLMMTDAWGKLSCLAYTYEGKHPPKSSRPT